MAKSISGRSWFNIRTNGAKFDWELKRMSTQITNAPNQIVKGYFAQVRDIAWQGVAVGREKIRTDTNTKQYRERGKKGRVDTGDMAKAFWANVRKDTDKKYAINVGYLGGKPGYSIFQEYGTSKGLTGVEALRASQEYIDREVKALGAGGRNYKRKIPEAVQTDTSQPPEWFRKQ